LPALSTSPKTPPWVGVEVEVEPPRVATEVKFFVPQLVCPERARNVEVSALAAGPSIPLAFGVRPLPGTTCGWNMPPWWSTESKSLEASAITTPRLQIASTAWRMKCE